MIRMGLFSETVAVKMANDGILKKKVAAVADRLAKLPWGWDSSTINPMNFREGSYGFLGLAKLGKFVN